MKSIIHEIIYWVFVEETRVMQLPGCPIIKITIMCHHRSSL